MEQMQTPPASSPNDELVKQLCANVAQSATWMKLLAVLMIIYGVMMVFTLVGILLCWLPIWLGVIIFKAAGDAETAKRGAPPKLLDFILKINRFFLIHGILALLGVVITLIIMFVWVLAVIWGALGVI